MGTVCGRHPHRKRRNDFARTPVLASSAPIWRHKCTPRSGARNKEQQSLMTDVGWAPGKSPLIGFGPEICSDLGQELRQEWLVTNGIDGYGAGNIVGCQTRRYHGPVSDRSARSSTPIRRSCRGAASPRPAASRKCYALGWNSTARAPKPRLWRGISSNTHRSRARGIK
jgi:hypothetical protein